MNDDIDETFVKYVEMKIEDCRNGNLKLSKPMTAQEFDDMMENERLECEDEQRRKKS